MTINKSINYIVMFVAAQQLAVFLFLSHKLEVLSCLIFMLPYRKIELAIYSR